MVKFFLFYDMNRATSFRPQALGFVLQEGIEVLMCLSVYVLFTAHYLPLTPHLLPFTLTPHFITLKSITLSA